MTQSPDTSQTGQVTLSVVIHGIDDANAQTRAIRQAEETLCALAQPYEILVVRANADDAGGSVAGEESCRNPHVRFVHGGGCGFAGAFKTAVQVARGSLIVLTDGSADLAALAYLVPCAQQHPIVWGYRIHRQGTFLYRCLSVGYSTMVRFLLGAPVRDCNGGIRIALFQRSVLQQIMPECGELHAAAEVLTRARQHDIPVVEAAISTPPAPIPPARVAWGNVGRMLAALLRYWWSGERFAGSSPGLPSTVSCLAGVLLAVLAALILFSKLGQPLLDPDEGRQAEIPREMLAHHDLLLPRMLGEPYYEKPPLQYWLTAAAYETFGMYSWSARVVPATAAWLAVMATFAWGRHVLGARQAFLGGLGLSLTPGFVVLGRTVVLDSLLAFCVVAAWYTAYLAVRRPPLRWPWWLLSALVCGLGILAKGPVALALLLPPVVAFQFLNPSAVRARCKTWAAYLGLALVVAAPWYVLMTIQDPDYLKQFLWRANFVRFVSPYDHEQPWWFYLPILFVATLPWSFLWPALIYFLGGRNPRLAQFRGPGLGFCLLTVVWCLTFYSLSGCKSPPYIAPALAPLALLLGACVDAIVFQATGQGDMYLAFVRQQLPRRLAYFALAISAGCYLMTSLLGWQAWGWALAKAGMSLGILTLWWLLGRRARPSVAWGVCAAIMLAFVTVALRDMTAGYASRHSPAPIAQVYRNLPNSSKRPVISYGRQWNSASFYLRRDVVCCFDDQHQLELIVFLCSNPKTLVLVESGPPLQEFLESLPSFLNTEVHSPKKEGQAALVVVRPTAQSLLGQNN